MSNLKLVFWMVLGLIGMLIFAFFNSLVVFYTDWLWFQSLGYESVFLKTISAQFSFGLLSGAGLFFFLYLNFFLAQRLAMKGSFKINEKFYDVLENRQSSALFNRTIGLIFLLVAILTGIYASTFWPKWLQFVNASSFNLKDPLFTQDIGFFVFQLPFLKIVYEFISMPLLLAFMVSALVYFYLGNIRFGLGGVKVSRVAQAHLLFLISLWFISLALGYRFQMYDLLFSQGGLFFGASYAQAQALLPVLNLLFYLSLIVAGLFLASAFIGTWNLAILGIFLIVVVSFFGQGLYPAFVQRFMVAPNELAKESPYIAHNIKYTRLAYGLDKMEEKNFEVRELSQKDLSESADTISNIRLWDHRPLKDAFSQLQEIRTYYNFRDVDIDRYNIKGKLTQVMLSARELDYESLPSRMWINEHLTYTHGYGIVMSPVNRVTQQGLPVFLIKDIPPTLEGFSIQRPEIYFGEKSNEYCFVNTKSKEFDYPSGQENIYSVYTGQGGVKLNSFFRKILFALRFSNLKILLSGDIDANSRVMYYRSLNESLKRITPFVHFDYDPYMVVSQGRLFWIADGYMLSDKFPYAQPFDGENNYIRNSVKVIIDAYNGSIQYYITDDQEPIALTYSKIFPRLFKPLSQMPADLKAHLRYAESYLKVQAEILRTYHMKDPQIFYNKEDVWEVPSEVEPYYTIIKMPGSQKAEFVLILPFTPSKKNNLAAWVAARCDGANYGQIFLYLFPKKQLVFGPKQIEARIDQDADISKELSLWNQRGSKVIRGNLLVIPVGQSLLYVEPLYLKAESGQIPELKRVVVAYGDQIAMEDNFESALYRVLGGKKKNNSSSYAYADSSQSDLTRQAKNAFDKAQSYLKAGNFSAFGEAFKELEKILNQLAK